MSSVYVETINDQKRSTNWCQAVKVQIQRRFRLARIKINLLLVGFQAFYTRNSLSYYI